MSEHSETVYQRGKSVFHTVDKFKVHFAKFWSDQQVSCDWHDVSVRI